MINPSGNEFEKDPLGASAGVGGETTYGSRTMPEQTAWEQTKETMGAARERTEIFVRENPIPVLLGALGLGVAIGLAIRYASTAAAEQEPEEKASDAMWSFVSLPFLWPFFKSLKEKAGDSAEAVKDGFERVKNVKVSRYTKPIRKRWKAWTR
jgi:hypothetical protein